MDEEFLELFGDISAYAKVVNRLATDTERKSTEPLYREPVECKHTSIIEDNLIKICTQCGKELKELDMSSEWRCYNSDTSSSRCHKSKKTRPIDDVLGNKDIPESIRDIVQDRFNQVTATLNTNNTKATLRKSKRTALIATCLFYTYMEKGQYYTMSHFYKMFDIDKQALTFGKEQYLRVFKDARTIMIKPEDLLVWLMNKINIPMTYYQDILKVVHIIKHTTTNLKKAKPQAVAAAIIYTWICTRKELYNELKMSKIAYSNIVGMSPVNLISLVNDIKDSILRSEESIAAC